MSKNKLTIILSGHKSSGKTTAAKYLFCEHINRKIGKKRLSVERVNKDIVVIDTFNNDEVLDINSDDIKQFNDAYSVKLYSFADPLKKICIDILGLDKMQCYGSEDDKNTVCPHINWESFSDQIRKKYSRPKRGVGGIRPASGLVTARELLQLIGTDYFRQIWPNCWAHGLYKSIENDGYELAIITDARFPNEITMGTERGAKAVRLLRNIKEDPHPSETALDDFPLGEFSLVIEDCTLETMFDRLNNAFQTWADTAKI